MTDRDICYYCDIEADLADVARACGHRDDKYRLAELGQCPCDHRFEPHEKCGCPHCAPSIWSGAPGNESEGPKP